MQCYGHTLNLACNDSVRQCKLMRDALDSSQEIIKLVKFSPRRDSVFQAIKSTLSPDTPGVSVVPHAVDSQGRCTTQHPGQLSSPYPAIQPLPSCGLRQWISLKTQKCALVFEV